MKKNVVHLTLFFLLLAPQAIQAGEQLFYHQIETDSASNILPWYNSDPAVSYDHVIGLVWNFWNSMRFDFNGLPYYMNHQVWQADHDDPRGLGGDQLQMAMSSWELFYAYSGSEQIKQNIKFIADYYLTHSLSASDSQWPNLPYPYNTSIYSGIYDGDMILGPNILQPDKAGSFGLELLHAYKMSSKDYSAPTTPGKYLSAAIKIAETLRKHLVSGNDKVSPLPFKVNALTGKIGSFLSNSGDGSVTGPAEYTTNWAPTMELFLELQSIDPNHKDEYQKAFNLLLRWMIKYPLQNNKWGPFFEDVQGYSDTQINAVTFARFVLQHRNYFPNWKTEVPKIFAWVYATLGNNKWQNYGLRLFNEQTTYQFPGQSHVARQGATELEYCKLSGDESSKAEAIRRMNWATYMVDVDGKNVFPFDANWLTDGYGDYVRHYLRAMAAYPELAPAQDHILSSTSIIQYVEYRTPDADNADRVYYRAFDSEGTETIRLVTKPSEVLVGGNKMIEADKSGHADTFFWQALAVGGVLEINRSKGTEVNIR